jgi:hypothetical protein
MHVAVGRTGRSPFGPRAVGVFPAAVTEDVLAKRVALRRRSGVGHLEVGIQLLVGLLESLVCDTLASHAAYAAQTRGFVCLFPSQNLRPETDTSGWLVRQCCPDEIREEECGMAIRARMTEEGLLIPREVAERALGEGLEEVEILEEPGRLLISPASGVGEAAKVGAGGKIRYSRWARTPWRTPMRPTPR